MQSSISFQVSQKTTVSCRLWFKTFSSQHFLYYVIIFTWTQLIFNYNIYSLYSFSYQSQWDKAFHFSIRKSEPDERHLCPFLFLSPSMFRCSSLWSHRFHFHFLLTALAMLHWYLKRRSKKSHLSGTKVSFTGFESFIVHLRSSCRKAKTLTKKEENDQ